MFTVSFHFKYNTCTCEAAAIYIFINIRSRGAPILTPIVLLAAEHVSKTKLQDKVSQTSSPPPSYF